MKKTLLAMALAFFCLSLGAQESKMGWGIQGAYYFPDQQGYQEGDGFTAVSYETVDPGDENLRILGSTWGAAELEFFFLYENKIPFLVGEGLLADNNLALKMRTGLSPVTLTQSAELTLTPIAFLNFTTGGQIGTGWNMGFNGLGRNLGFEMEGRSFPGAVLEYWAAGTFQFDLGVVVPGEWNHLVMVATSKLRYQHFTGAEGGPWQYKADAGENFNEWLLENSFFLGHQPPIDAIDTWGFLAESKARLFDSATQGPMDGTMGNNWGSDFVSWVWGPLVNFQLQENQSLALLLQMENFIRYTEATIFDRDFTQREYEGTNWRLKRLALVYNFQL